MRRSVLNPTVAVRPCGPGDLTAAERLLAAAFGHAPAPVLEKRLALSTTHAFVAVDDTDAVVGFVTLSRYGTIGYVGSMGVEPARQRSGVGNALMNALVAFCRERDLATLALDATEAGAPLYARFGFETTDHTIVLKRVAPFAHTIGSPSDPSELALAIALDEELLGCDRSYVLAMLAHEDGAYIAADGDGYALCWGGIAGPVVANSSYGARAVLARALRESANVTRMLVPESTPGALEIASQHGFKIASTCAHMTRGVSPFTREAIFARASHSYG